MADPKSGPCPFYSVGDEFIFERYGEEDTFWRMGSGTQCSEAVRTALEAVDGVERVEVKLDKKWAEVFICIRQ